MATIEGQIPNKMGDDVFSGRSQRPRLRLYVENSSMSMSSPLRPEIRFFLMYYEDRGGGRSSIAEPVTMRELTVKEEMGATMPTFCLDRDMAQELMDRLWDCSFRPTEGTGSAGSLAATERHLKDLQRLVFKDQEEDRQRRGVEV